MPCKFRIFINDFAFLYVKANCKESCEEISFPSWFRKMQCQHCCWNLEKMRSYPNCSLWIPIAVGKIYFLCVVLIWRKLLCILKAPFLKRQPRTVFSSMIRCSMVYHERALLILILYHRVCDAWWEGWMYYSKYTTVFVCPVWLYFLWDGINRSSNPYV